MIYIPTQRVIISLISTKTNPEIVKQYSKIPNVLVKIIHHHNLIQGYILNGSIRAFQY